MQDVPLSIGRLLEHVANVYPDTEVVTATEGGTRRRTYAEVAERAARLANALRGLGVDGDQRVATFMWNNVEHLEAYAAVPSMGAVLHTLNIRLFPEQLTYIANHAEDHVVIVDACLLAPFATLLPTFETVRHVLVAGPEAADADLSVIESASVQVGLYEDALAAADAAFVWPDVDERDAAAMCYTSGTTGNPKGVVYSHRSAYLHSMAVAMGDAMGLTPFDKVLPIVPMFHANAWGLPYAAAMIGAALVLPGPKLDAVSILDLLADERVTMTAGVPTVWMAVLEALDKEPDQWDLSALRQLLVGGSAAPKSLMQGFDRHGLTIVHAWGMTEMSPLGTVCRLPVELDDASEEEQYAYRSRQGTASPFVELRARGEDGELIPWDDQAMGELEVRGPWVAAGYHRGQGAEKFTDDGWFQTGDVVAISAQGNIRICDRSKDLVKSGGEWISSVDLENLLMAHPAVAEAAVIAIPDERWGERPLGVVVVREGQNVSPDQLREHLGSQYAKWQLPERFEFIDEIPRTATGKFKKTELRERFVTGAAV